MLDAVDLKMERTAILRGHGLLSDRARIHIWPVWLQDPLSESHPHVVLDGNSQSFSSLELKGRCY